MIGSNITHKDDLLNIQPVNKVKFLLNFIYCYIILGSKVKEFTINTESLLNQVSVEKINKLDLLQNIEL